MLLAIIIIAAAGGYLFFKQKGASLSSLKNNEPAEIMQL
jgi:hypothetical protein